MTTMISIFSPPTATDALDLSTRTISVTTGLTINNAAVSNSSARRREEFQYIGLNKEAELKRELKKLEMQLRKYPNRTDLKLAMLNIRNELKKLKRK